MEDSLENLNNIKRPFSSCDIRVKAMTKTVSLCSNITLTKCLTFIVTI